MVLSPGLFFLLAHGAAQGLASVASNAADQDVRMAGVTSMSRPTPPHVMAGAPTKATISCGMALLMTPSATL